MFYSINCIILIIIIYQYDNKMIVLPFRASQNNFVEDINIWDKFFPKELYTEVLIGDPPQCLNINIDTEKYNFYISNRICYANSPSYYNYSKSKSFHIANFGFEEDMFDETSEGAFATEFFSFYNSTNFKTNVTIDEFDFFYDSYLLMRSHISDKICGTAGLGLKERNKDSNVETFLYALKKKNLINNYTWTYIYFDKDIKNNKILNLPEINNKYIINNYDGMIILGKYPHEYNSNDYDEKYFVSILASKRDNDLKWDIIFNRIYCDNNYQYNISVKAPQATLSLDYDYVLAPIDFFEQIIIPFFNSYIIKLMCNIHEIKKGAYAYDVIFCDKELFKNDDKRKFPTIYFYHKDFNYTFELTYEDLFEEINDNIFFLIIKNKRNYYKNLWKMGKIFLRKYHFSFNQDSKMISFYNNMKAYNHHETNKNNIIDKNRKNFNTNYIWIIVCVVCLICGIYIGNRIIVRNRKLRANELEDQYDYKSDTIKNDKKNFLNEKNIEMRTKSLGLN